MCVTHLTYTETLMINFQLLNMIALTKDHRNDVILVLQELAVVKKPVLPNNLLEQLLNVHTTRCIHCYWFHEPPKNILNRSYIADF